MDNFNFYAVQTEKHEYICCGIFYFYPCHRQHLGVDMKVLNFLKVKTLLLSDLCCLSMMFQASVPAALRVVLK